MEKVCKVKKSKFHVKGSCSLTENTAPTLPETLSLESSLYFPDLCMSLCNRCHHEYMYLYTYYKIYTLLSVSRQTVSTTVAVLFWVTIPCAALLIVSVAKRERSRHSGKIDAEAVHHLRKIMCFLKMIVYKPILLGPPNRGINLNISIIWPL